MTDEFGRAKPARSSYRRRLPHLQMSDRALFVTFNTWQRTPLPERVRAAVLEHCLHDHQRKYWMHAAVVMPDHVHLLFSALTDERGNVYGLAEIMQGIKGASAHTVNRLLRRSGRVWSPESFDRSLRRDEGVREKAEYICENPVRAGLVRPDGEYRWLWREWIDGTADSAE